ncbi:MAG: tetratricopeptide repeat protein, partial [Chloroflexales bacterium]
AMGLYEQSLRIQESLGDIKGKSATLHAMANVRVTRGDLAGAMGLYEQSLRIQESLGDIKGKSATLANMAGLQFRQGDHATALHNARTSFDLLQGMGAASDAAQVASIIQQMEAALAGAPPPGLRDAIIAWRDGERDEDSLAALLNATCNTVVGIIREGDGDAREALAADLALLRAVRPLPIPATNEFLHLLQLWLRDEPGMAARATQLRAGLPDMFIGALENMERSIAGTPDKDEDVPEDEEANAMAGHLATMLEVVPPAQRPILTSVITQILPFIQATAAALSNPQVGPQERAEFATRLEDVANQAAAGKAPGSPWLDAAAALRALATRLRGGAVDPETLAEPFRSLVGPLL